MPWGIAASFESQRIRLGEQPQFFGGIFFLDALDQCACGLIVPKFHFCKAVDELGKPFYEGDKTFAELGMALEELAQGVVAAEDIVFLTEGVGGLNLQHTGIGIGTQVIEFENGQNLPTLFGLCEGIGHQGIGIAQ